VILARLVTLFAGIFACVVYNRINVQREPDVAWGEELGALELGRDGTETLVALQ